MQKLELSAFLELLKPITWFAPMWAFACGIVSSGLPPLARWHVVAARASCSPARWSAPPARRSMTGIDRHVDAINEPNRPIPSGRIPGRWGLYIACLWTVLSLAARGGAGPLGVRRGRLRACAGLGLQRAAACG